MPYFEPELQLTEEEFRLIRDLIYNHCGLFFDDDSKYLLDRRLGQRVTHHNLSGFREYYQFLKYDRRRDEEIADIMDLLTTNETYFFREAFQLRAFTDEIVPELMKLKQRERTLRIWSAGCSTGEEPYTIAMLLLEMGCFHGWRIEIVGSDISHRVVQHARKGIYTKASFRATDERYLKRFFTETDEGYRICDEVRELVTISQMNLFDANRLALLGKMDVIFCRNVIIYFDQTSKKRVIESFYNTLRGGGYLLLGHSESLMNLSTAFALKHLKNDMVYQKTDTTGGGVPK
ncbi:protein-glutamate O-methyltransferase CheR [Geomonas sp. Red69]|uniref:Protein-glutamate O-methyltransferase CheR n=1 Tax=Geomonas diazotrophica TaxID=2843197 RepID=A0ABX8JLI4_9BACT|nr:MULTISPECIES: protein-glutamate O-methyltransferase CheR [Geomonas]MBU5635560.1 protein-glutamate O-methyltransferase CheR [Geomonas diazotrophica]QWV98197.1 protein-glutamate O-methyltransferase CheR [Geomonas nitrogeniifigens]QXE87326.1 protein-glutamate O-methyltransferase CheR [Geomonas nitrogeniifigens]